MSPRQNDGRAVAGRTDSVVDTNHNKTQSITEERQRTNLYQAYRTYGAKLICERRVGQRDPVPLELEEEEEEDRLRNASAFHELQVEGVPSESEAPRGSLGVRQAAV